jgi:uncharacterized protein (DUF433 family)
MTTMIKYPHIELRVSVHGMGEEFFVAGTNVPVRRIYDWFRRGVPAETLMKRYPQLGPAKVLSALAFAHDHKDVVEKDIERAEQAARAETIPPPSSSAARP